MALYILSTVLIIIGTLFPSNYNLPNDWHYDKIAHFLMFGMWTFFYGIIRFLKAKYALWPVFLWGTFFGFLIEALQFVLPTNRSAEMLDLAADIAGVTIAVFLLYLVLKNVSNLRKSPTL